jgi:hypothetical protein
MLLRNGILVKHGRYTHVGTVSIDFIVYDKPVGIGSNNLVELISEAWEREGMHSTNCRRLCLVVGLPGSCSGPLPLTLPSVADMDVSHVSLPHCLRNMVVVRSRSLMVGRRSGALRQVALNVR